MDKKYGGGGGCCVVERVRLFSSTMPVSRGTTRYDEVPTTSISSRRLSRSNSNRYQGVRVHRCMVKLESVLTCDHRESVQ